MFFSSQASVVLKTSFFVLFNLRSQLMALGLVDEYYFVIHPIIAGNGKHLLEDITLRENINLKLADVKVFKSGCVGLHYLKG
ncbi:MAG: hypothetical protein EOO91_06585 [Pedobacter sp.]|nr:MAG: hypothetical protein EOO91_06585 [Pedobacter sp.]